MTKQADERLSATLGVRVTAAELARIDAIVARLPVASRHAIAREALRIGLEAIEENPAILLGEKPKKGKR
jgi:hypothetical protein